MLDSEEYKQINETHYKPHMYITHVLNPKVYKTCIHLKF